jgi:alpha-glucoside transport system substrate-binding protein
MKRQKWLLVLGISLVIMGLLAACGPAVTPAPAVEEPVVEEPVEEPAVEEPAAPEIECFGSEGSTVSVLAVWSGDEEANFKAIFEPVLAACDLTLEYEGTRDLSAVLQTRVDGGDPPDLSLMPNVGSLETYKDDLIPMADLGANLDNYSPSWLALGTVEGDVYGIFVKSDIKSLVWYSPVAFEAAGYTVPTSWEDFVALVDQMAADGNVPLSMGMESGAATGWTGTDFVQDILLRTEGFEYVNSLVVHDVAWNDAGVKGAWEIYGGWATDPAYALGGADGTVSTGFLDAIYAVFSDPPQAYMVKQSGFAGGAVQSQYPELEFGTDFDFFVMPGPGGEASPMQVGGDGMAAFNDTPAVRAVVAYLTSAAGGKAWAASGFDLSPNNKVSGDDYADPISAKKADALAAAPAVSFDVGDLLKSGLGADEFTSITAYINGGDLDEILGMMEVRATEVYGETAEIDCFGAEGSSVSMLAVWSGDEEATFKGVLAPVLEACDLTLEYEGTRDLAALLQTRVEGGDPPDISLMPGVGTLLDFAAAGDLVPVAEAGANLDNYAAGWSDLVTYDGEVYGVFVKTDVKSLVWYSPIAFEAAGYAVPTSWEDFVALADQMVADGNVPFSMGMESGAATGWTGTDFVQDMLLRSAGTEFVNGLATGESAWNDPQVVAVWNQYGGWAADPAYALGGADGTVSTGFLDAIYAVFSDPPEAYMVKQSGFGGGAIQGQYPELEFGTDFDFFVMPGMGGAPAPMQVGGDAIAVFNNTPAAQAVMAYLTSGRGGRAWAASGFDLTPNNQVTGLSYTNTISAKKADALLRASDISFDVGDLMKGGLNMLEFEQITAFVNAGGTDAQPFLDTMQARAAEVYP